MDEVFSLVLNVSFLLFLLLLFFLIVLEIERKEVQHSKMQQLILVLAILLEYFFFISVMLNGSKYLYDAEQGFKNITFDSLYFGNLVLSLLSILFIFAYFVLKYLFFDIPLFMNKNIINQKESVTDLVEAFFYLAIRSMISFPVEGKIAGVIVFYLINMFLYLFTFNITHVIY